MCLELGLGLAAVVTTLAYCHFSAQNKPAAHISCKLKVAKLDWFSAGIMKYKPCNNNNTHLMAPCP